MFAPRYFARRYFPGRYFPPVVTEEGEEGPPPITTVPLPGIGWQYGPRVRVVGGEATFRITIRMRATGTSARDEWHQIEEDFLLGIIDGTEFAARANALRPRVSPNDLLEEDYLLGLVDEDEWLLLGAELRGDPPR